MQVFGPEELIGYPTESKEWPSLPCRPHQGQRRPHAPHGAARRAAEVDAEGGGGLWAEPPSGRKAPSDVWLAPWTAEASHELWVCFDEPVALSLLRMQNQVWVMEAVQNNANPGLSKTMINGLNTSLATIAGVIFFGSQLSVQAVAGVALALAGTYLTTADPE